MDHRFCFIVSSMRAGSTLLKALIATRPDCSDLPEMPFSDCLSINSDAKIIVIKKPAGYGNLEYPNLPSVKSKKIVLIRHPYDTICSLHEMNLTRNQVDQYFSEAEYLISYWFMVYDNVRAKKILDNEDSLLVRYEDLIASPIDQSEKIFKFIETAFLSGTDTYSAPANYKWEWKKDDGGDVIKTLKVQKKAKNTVNDELMSFIKSTKEIQELLSYYGY